MKLYTVYVIYKYNNVILFIVIDVMCGDSLWLEAAMRQLIYPY